MNKEIDKMTKAEKAATELGYHCDPYNRAEFTANDVREAAIEGYSQAEKGLELTWEDIRELHILFETVDVEIELGQSNMKKETLGYYEEVLRRFISRRNT